MESALHPESVVEIAVPGFLALIALEIAVSYFRKSKIYRALDTFQNLALGMTQQMVGILSASLMIGIYIQFQKSFSIQAWTGLPLWPDDFQTAAGISSWIISFILIDFFYYWFHRSAHERSLLWGSHVAHHSSEEYNLAVALRQSATQKFFSVWFYLPLAFIGVTWKQMAVGYGLNLVYQFWIHTRLIGRLGVLEHFLSTPSHHRVHHGRNPKYIDKNHGGVFIIWDKLFGTFKAEEEEPVYGITTRLDSFNPWTANLHHYRFLWNEIKCAKNWADRFRFLWKPPGWRPEYLGPSLGPKEIQDDPRVAQNPFSEFNETTQQRIILKTGARFLFLLGIGTQILEQAQHGDEQLAKLLAIWMLFALGVQGWISDRSKSALVGLFTSALLLGGFCFPFTNTLDTKILVSVASAAEISFLFLFLNHPFRPAKPLLR